MWSPGSIEQVSIQDLLGMVLGKQRRWWPPETNDHQVIIGRGVYSKAVFSNVALWKEEAVFVEKSAW